MMGLGGKECDGGRTEVRWVWGGRGVMEGGQRCDGFGGEGV